MAYYKHYECNFSNRNTNNILIEFWKKDAFADSYTILPCVSVKSEYYDGNEDKFLPTILGLKLEVVIRAQINSADTINAEMFYPESSDQWKIVAYSDGKCFFRGYIVNDVEPYQLKNKPYNIVVRATDQIMKLKNFPLRDTSDAKFSGRNTLLEYLTGALNKTGLLGATGSDSCMIRAYVNIYNNGQNDRADAGQPDMLTQTQLHHRSLLKDVNEFYDCYTAIERMLKGWCILYQYEGDYCIVNLQDIQAGWGSALSGPPFPINLYYNKYDSSGSRISFNNENYEPLLIGKNGFIQPIELNQYVNYAYPYKSVKTTFSYDIPDNLLNNQRIQELGDFLAPVSGSGYAGYELVGWTHYKGQPQTGLPTSETPSSSTAYIKTEFNAYNVETDRYYVVPKDVTAPSTTLENYIRNDNADFWVDEGDKISIAITFRTKIDESTTDLFLASLIILKDGTTGSSSGDWYSLSDTGTWNNNPNTAFAEYNISADTTLWKTVSFTDIEIPANGTMYLLLGSGDVVVAGNEVYFKDIDLVYTPYVKGSRLSVKGDYWKTEQNTTLSDTLEEEIFISDAPKRIIKGALWNQYGLALTNPDWYRYGKTENLHFKEIVNLTRYRHQYRPTRKISGTFKGVMWQSVEGFLGTTNMHPLSLHNQFRFENDPANAVYVFTAPMEIDWVSARFNATLVEVYRDGDEYDNVGDSHTFNYIF